MAWLGNVGALVELPFHDSRSESHDRASSQQVTLGGRRLVQLGPSTRRTWDVSLWKGSSTDLVARALAFSEGEHGRGPWWWVSDWASTTNVLTPDMAMMRQVPVSAATTAGGPMRLPGGDVAGSSLLLLPGQTLWPLGDNTRSVPVVPGRPVTVSAWVEGGTGTYILAQLLDSSGAVLRSVTKTRLSTAGSAPERLSVTLDAMEGEHLVRFMVRNTTGSIRVSRPAVTWTRELRDWGVGAGCAQTVAIDFSVDPQMLRSVRGTDHAAVSFKIVEVG